MGPQKIVIDPDRMAAYKALVRIEKSKAYSNIELNAILEKPAKGKSKNSFDPAKSRSEKPAKEKADVIVNPGFVRELVYGVVRNRRYLDYYIDDLAANGIESIHKEVTVLIRTGIYQLVFMDSVPDHSAVDETVKIAKLLFPGRGGFVNGILRNFIRLRDKDYGKPGCEGRNIPVPDIEDPVKRLSVMYSCDEGLVKLLVDQYGTDKAEEFLKVSLETPPLFIRVNTLKTDAAELADSLQKHGFKADIYSNESLVVSGRGIIESKEFRDGKFFVQDASSTMAIKALAPEAEEVLIDVCAAPGGKTFSAACMMEGRGRILAMDLHGNKLRALTREAKRLGISIIETRENDAKSKASDIGQADKVICDVPCSGLGVLRRKPEIKDRPLKKDGRELAEIQYMILCSSSEYVKPGGELMYSTCTVNKIENEEVTDRFLSEHGDFSRRCSHVTMPCSGGSDGFYYCILKRNI